MEQIISCWRPSWSYYQAPSTRIHFLLKMRFFFAVFKIDPFTRSVFESFSSVQKCPFSFENANVFSVFDNLSVLSYRFWYCDIVFKKFRFEESTRKQKNSAFNVKSSHAKSSWFLYSTQAGGGGKRRGLGPRNDVLTTCKAVTLRGGQRIIAVFFSQWIFLDLLEARSEPVEEIRNA